MLDLFKEIKGIFVQPKKRYYLGRIAHGCPYFYPLNFVSTIIKFRRLKLRDEAEYSELIAKSPWLKDSKKFTNMVMVHRSKEWTFKLFNNWYWLQIGWPVYIYWHDLGYKWKYDSTRFEWCPAFYIFFFKWQFCIHWTAPDKDNDKYYEMILHWKHSSNKDIVKAENTWGWVNCETKESTWDKKYVL